MYYSRLLFMINPAVHIVAVSVMKSLFNFFVEKYDKCL